MIHADAGGVRATDHHKVGDAVGRGAAGVKVVGTVADRGHRCHDHREVFRQTAGHHSADRHFRGREALVPDAFGSQDIVRGQSAVVQQGLHLFRSGRNNRQPVGEPFPEIVFQGGFPTFEFPRFHRHSDHTLSQRRRPAQSDDNRTGAGKVRTFLGVRILLVSQSAVYSRIYQAEFPESSALFRTGFCGSGHCFCLAPLWLHAAGSNLRWR